MFRLQNLYTKVSVISGKKQDAPQPRVGKLVIKVQVQTIISVMLYDAMEWNKVLSGKAILLYNSTTRKRGIYT